MAVNDDPEKHRGRPKTSHTDWNCVIIESLIREDQNAKQYFTSFEREHDAEWMFKLVRRWDKCLNANVDYVEE
jgi:hypothetical protein